MLNPEEAAAPFDTVAPTAVVTWIADGESPLAAVQRLVRPAMDAAGGFLPAAEDCVVSGLVLLDPGPALRSISSTV